MLIGVWVMVVLYLGFPANWDRILLIATGLLIITLGYRMKPPAAKEVPFVENKTPTSPTAGAAS